MNGDQDDSDDEAYVHDGSIGNQQQPNAPVGAAKRALNYLMSVAFNGTAKEKEKDDKHIVVRKESDVECGDSTTKASTLHMRRSPKQVKDAVVSGQLSTESAAQAAVKSSVEKKNVRSFLCIHYLSFPDLS